MTTTVGVKTVIRSAEVRGGEDDRSPGDAPPQIIDASELETSAADLTTLEQSLAQSDRGHAVSGFDEISVSARTAYFVARIGRGVVGGSRGAPFGGGGRYGGGR